MYNVLGQTHLKCSDTNQEGLPKELTLMHFLSLSGPCPPVSEAHTGVGRPSDMFSLQRPILERDIAIERPLTYNVLGHTQVKCNDTNQEGLPKELTLMHFLSTDPSPPVTEATLALCAHQTSPPLKAGWSNVTVALRPQAVFF